MAMTFRSTTLPFARLSCGYVGRSDGWTDLADNLQMDWAFDEARDGNKLFLTGNGKYGAVAASLLVLVAWLWVFVLITVIGAQINAVAIGIKPTCYDLPRTLVQAYEQEIAPPPKEAPASTPSTPPSRTSSSLVHPGGRR